MCHSWCRIHYEPEKEIYRKLLGCRAAAGFKITVSGRGRSAFRPLSDNTVTCRPQTVSRKLVEQKTSIRLPQGKGEEGGLGGGTRRDEVGQRGGEADSEGEGEGGTP